jgi:TRAP-type C4-dicarboxylate transport system permease small subunit
MHASAGSTDVSHPKTEPEGRIATAARQLHYVVNLATLGIATMVIGADVVLRYLFNSPLLWSIEATGLLLLVMVFGSLPYVWEHGGHISMELLYTRLRGVPRIVADLLTALSGGIFSGLLCYQMMITFPAMRARNEGAEFLGVPHWPFALFIAVIGGLMTLQFVLFAIRAITQRRD